MKHIIFAGNVLTSGVLAILLSMVSAPLHATEAILIGGGYSLEGSQGQIELNTQWVQQILKSRGVSVTTFYTDGDDSGADVHYLQPEDQYKSDLEPLARIYNNLERDRRVYRNHAVDDVTSGTQRDTLLPQLQQLLDAETTDDKLFIYNGHGNQSTSTADKVTMHLWDDTIIQANELHDMLEDNTTPFRFVMTQCYSGGFHRLAYENSASGLALADSAPRCGFTAESAYRLSEGCSSSINTADYRDYTSYFFAALTGTDRNGNAIESSADSDGNGTTSLREAHLYTLANAVSTDLPRSTSEDFLHSWQPWHLRWTPTDSDIPDNEYKLIYQTLAEKLSIDPWASNAARIIQEQLTTLSSERESLDERFNSTRNDIRSLQLMLRQQLTERWPDIGAPYTASFLEKATDGTILEAAQFAANLEEYDELVSTQLALAELQDDVLDNERNQTQMQKLQHLRRLALLKAQLQSHGKPEEVADYNALLMCESGDL